MPQVVSVSARMAVTEHAHGNQRRQQWWRPQPQHQPSRSIGAQGHAPSPVLSPSVPLSSGTKQPCLHHSVCTLLFVLIGIFNELLWGRRM